jgi:hypothetical protein
MISESKYLIRLKQENFHVRIRREKVEEVLKQKRLQVMHQNQ